MLEDTKTKDWSLTTASSSGSDSKALELRQPKVTRLSVWNKRFIPGLMSKSLHKYLIVPSRYGYGLKPARLFVVGDVVNLVWRAKQPFARYCPTCGRPKVFCSYHYPKRAYFHKLFGKVKIVKITPLEFWIGYDSAMIKGYSKDETAQLGLELGFNSLKEFYLFMLFNMKLDSKNQCDLLEWEWQNETDGSSKDKTA